MLGDIRDDIQVIKRLVLSMTAPPAQRARRYYELTALGEPATVKTTYMNLGYWSNGAADLDAAAEDMAELLASRAGFMPGDRILDAGFGYGDQDFYWVKTRDPKEIVGVDVTPMHVAAATARARREGLADVLRFREGSATALEFPAGSFDRVVALESAFHFLTREDFFRQAYRVLRPGGTIATVDVAQLEPAEARAKPAKGIDWNAAFEGKDRQRENWYPAAGYANALTRTGFTNVRAESIRDDVLEPWRRFLTGQILDPSRRPRGMKLVLLNQLRRQLREGADTPMNIDYIIAVAEKPMEPS
jgi:erythromycin 3''-O-methyltransferase